MKHTLCSISVLPTKGWTYLVGERRGKALFFSLVFCVFIVIGSAVKLDAVLDFADDLIFMMAICNLIGLYILAPAICRNLNEFW